MKHKKLIVLLSLSLIVMLSLAIALMASAVGGAAFTTIDPSVDGAGKDICKNSAINCNLYGDKEYVWLNGGPDANHLKPDGYYFFAVLEPGGQPNPNDQGGVPDKNLSDDWDDYTNRVFKTSGGEVSEYGGTHNLDSGTGPTCTNPHGCAPDGDPPFIRLMPYSDTTNPGGVYIMAICYIGEDGSDYPVDPRDCKYDAFKVKEGKVTYEFMLSGIKFEDKDGDGVGYETGDALLEGWTITIKGTGFAGEVIDASVQTDENGEWSYNSMQYTFNKTDTVYDAQLTICEVVQGGWTQTFPPGDCYDITIPPAAAAVVPNLDFGNFKNVEVEACKYEDKTGDGLTEDDTPIEGWTVHLTKNGEVQDTQTTGSDGCYKWTDLAPVPDGYYDVSEDVPDGWTPTSDTSHNFESPPQSGASYSFTFTNFKNVEVTACKLKDADGDLATTDDQTPIEGWTVNLTKNGEIQDTRTTGSDGCYTWSDLPPVPGGYYDVSEEARDGWIALTPTFYAFESPPTSGATYSFTFINQPTQGCTPGFWQGGPDKPDAKAGGALLWDGFATVPPVDDPNYPGSPQSPPYVDPQWVASGGFDGNPYIHTTPFTPFFTFYDIPNDGTTADYTMFELVDTGGGSENWRKLARDVVAAYLNSSWGMAYAYTPGEIRAIWDDAVANDTFLYWHTKLDAANNGPGGCPISASGW